MTHSRQGRDMTAKSLIPRERVEVLLFILSTLPNHEIVLAVARARVASANPSAGFFLPIKKFAVWAGHLKTAVVSIIALLEDALLGRQLLVVVDHIAREKHRVAIPSGCGHVHPRS